MHHDTTVLLSFRPGLVMTARASPDTGLDSSILLTSCSIAACRNFTPATARLCTRSADQGGAHARDAEAATRCCPCSGSLMIRAHLRANRTCMPDAPVHDQLSTANSAGAAHVGAANSNSAMDMSINGSSVMIMKRRSVNPYCWT